jgi:hypothetical protein
MRTQCFPLFHSPIDLAHNYWKQLLQPGDNVIDATCGNGKDTLFLTELLFTLSDVSTLIAIDIQQQAIEKTRSLLKACDKNIHFYTQSHATFPEVAYTLPIRLIVYNFGYLPQGDKSLTTLTESSLASLKAALALVMPGGCISATCYPGHLEGSREETALLALTQTLDPTHWCITWHTWPNRTLSPSLLLIQKNHLSK